MRAAVAFTKLVISIHHRGVCGHPAAPTFMCACLLGSMHVYTLHYITLQIHMCASVLPWQYASALAWHDRFDPGLQTNQLVSSGPGLHVVYFASVCSCFRCHR
jgi:hypothetical protein